MRTHVEHYTDVPSDKPSWVIVENRRVYHEGDERSRQHPGHGYPAHTEFTAKIILVFDNEQELVQELGSLIRHCGDSNQYRGFKVQPYAVSTGVRIWPGMIWPGQVVEDVVVDGTNDDKGKNSAKNDDKPLTSN